MRKRLLSCILICILCATLFPVSAFAEGTPSEGTTVYVCDSGDDTKDGLSAENALKTLSKAIGVIDQAGGGGTIVVCGELTIRDKQTTIQTTDSSPLTITASGIGAKLTVNQTTDDKTTALIYCLTPVTFENITIDYIGTDTLQFYAGPSLTIGDGVTTLNNGAAFTGNTVVIRGGVRNAACNTSKIKVQSGTWGYISGGNDKKAVTNASIELSGTAKVLSFVQAGGTKQQVSNATVSITGVSVPKVYAGGYGTAVTGECDITIRNAEVDAIYDVRTPSSGAEIKRSVDVTVENSNIPVLDLSSVPPGKPGTLNIKNGGISRFDNMFGAFADVKLEGNTTMYIRNFTAPSSSLYVGAGASLVLDSKFNQTLPEYTGEGSVSLAAIPITDLDTNYQGSLLMTHDRVSAVCDGTARSAQGIAGYENYIVVLYNAGTAGIYDMNSDTPEKPVGVVDLESFCISVNGDKNYTNHCNSAVFSDEKWDENDPLPLLYVTTGKSYNADAKGYIARCSVERFTYNEENGWGTQTVQTIIYNDNDYCADTYVPADRLAYNADTNTFPYPDRPELGFVNTNHYERIGWGWPTWFVDSDPTSETDGYIYTFRARFQSTLTGEAEDQARYGITDYETDNEFIITKFELPDLPASEAEFGREVTLTPVDIKDQFTTEFALYYTQGGTMYQNNIYFMCGHGDMEHGFKDGMNVFNVKDKKVIAKVDLSTAICGTEEMQGALVYDDKLVINTNLFHLYQLDYIESDWLVTQEATGTSDGKEVKIDCVSGEIREQRTIPALGTDHNTSASKPSYSVSLPDKTTGGSVSVSSKKAKKGSTVTVTVTPDEGHTLETLTITDKNGNALELTDKGNGTYTFKMPAGNVTVEATFMEDNTILNFFVDVPANAYYYDAVLWAAKNGVTGGVDETHFAPDRPCTRAQIVTFLWRAAGSPAPIGANSFTDVPSDAYYAKAVAWAVENGITTGVTADTFCPDQTCTRAQAVAFLFRYAASQGMDAVTLQELVSGYGDAAQVPGYALSAFNWALANGVVAGNNGNLMPNNDCTRAQIVTMLYRLLGE